MTDEQRQEGIDDTRHTTHNKAPRPETETRDIRERERQRTVWLCGYIHFDRVKDDDIE
jgi:hypothetical protein